MPGPDIPAEVTAHYERYDERTRLREGDGQLEEARTRILIERLFPPAPGVVLDIGGGPGAYANWLAAAGYEVHLRDPMPRHIEEAMAASDAGHPLASAAVGDARHLDFTDESADAVLLLGPLYHLTEFEDRIGALREVRRVLKPGGVVLAAAVSRFASALDGIWRNLVADPEFRSILERDLADGQHRNPTGNLTYWTTAYLHEPEEFAAELDAAGLQRTEVLAVEGIGWIMPDFDERWADMASRRHILDVVARTEREPTILGVSPHLLGVGWKPE
jgi:ubiquinone/menaquinone biosynthesis C-methylase UbiE